MAVLEMRSVMICALKKDRKKILELLQSKGCLEISQDIDDETLDRMNTATQISIFERNAALAESAIEILDAIAPKETSMLSSLQGKKLIEREEFSSVADDQGRIMDLVNNIISEKKQIEERENLLSKCRDEIAALEPWKGLGEPMNFSGTEKTAFMIGIIPDGITQDDLVLKLCGMPEFPDEAYACVVKTEQYQTYIACICLKSNQEQTEKALRELGFSRPPVVAHHLPEKSIENREKRAAQYAKEIDEIKSSIREEAQSRGLIEEIADYYRVRADKYRVLGDLKQSRHVFFVTGYMPENKTDEVREALEKNFTVAMETGEAEAAPVLLKNNRVSSAVEGVVTSFGYPHKGEIDPTTITSFFYYFLFGIMLSDAAYGLIMMIGCYVLLKKFPRMSESMAQTFRMFMYCGVSTFIWGILFGGFFGDAVSVIGETFFNVDIAIEPLWFAPIDDPMKMLIYCLGFGIIHLFTGLGIAGYMYLKKGDVMSFVCDVVFWYVFLIGLIMLLLPTEIFSSLAGVTITFPAAVSTLSVVMAVGGMLGILLMAGRRSKNPVKRLLLGAYSLYDTTSWLSDLLSYSRLLALGLATGVIAQVINTMAAMGGRSVVGVIMFIVVFIIGHTFNMAVNLLGAYVHTNRLQYVEFFGKFYEGGGRQFKPFKESTKYVDVKENQ